MGFWGAFFFRRSVSAGLVPKVVGHEMLTNPYTVEVNEQLAGYIDVHRFLTAEVRCYQDNDRQGTPLQAALADVFFKACTVCGSGTPPVELIERTRLIFNQVAGGGGQDKNEIRTVALKLGRIFDALSLFPVMMSVSESEQDFHDRGFQSLASCFADSFLYAHSLLDSVSGDRPYSVFTPAEWTIPSMARRIMDACANA
jgi:hypothetical protein